MLRALTVELFAILMVFMLVLAGAAPCRAGLGYSGFWESEEAADGSFEHNYSQSVGVDLAQEPAPFVRLAESFRYSNSWVRDQGTRATFSPDVDLRVLNHLFLFDLKGAASRNLRDRNLPARNVVELAWNSVWDEPLWPGFTLTVNHEESYDHLAPRRQDRVRQYLDGGLSWELPVLQLFYNYKASNNENRLTNLVDSQADQVGRLQAGRAFFDGRLRLNFSQEVRGATSRYETAVDELGTARVNTPIAQVDTGSDPLPEDSDDIALTVNNAMRDGDHETAAYQVGPGSEGSSILIRVNGQEVNYLYLSTDKIALAAAGSLVWRLFSSDLPGSGWEAEGLNSSLITYDSLNQRFVIPVGTGKRSNYLKLVIDYPGSSDLTVGFSEIEALRLVTELQGDVFTTENDLYATSTTFGLDLLLRDNLSLRYDFLGSNEQNQPGNDLTILYHSANLEYRSPEPGGLSALARVSDNLLDQEGSVDFETLSYGGTLRRTFFENLFTSLGWTRTVNIFAGIRSSNTDNYNFLTNAQLYPDLTAQFECRYIETRDFAADNDQRSTELDLNLTSRVKPDVTMTLTEGMSDSGRRGGGSETTWNSGLSTTWQPSGIFSGSLDLNYSSAERSRDTRGAALRAGIRSGGGTQFSISYSVTKQDQVSRSGDAALNMALGRLLNWQSRLVYSGDLDNHLMLNTSLSGRFSIR